MKPAHTWLAVLAVVVVAASCFLVVRFTLVGDKTRPGETEPTTPPAREQPAEREGTVESGFSLRGHVVTRDGQVPIEGAEVSLDMQHDVPSAVTDESGAFELTAVTPGDGWICVSHPDYASTMRPYAVPADPDHDVLIELIHGGRIFGTVTDPEGKPIKGASMTIKQAPFRFETTETDAEGSYELVHVSPGSLVLIANDATWQEGAASGWYLGVRMAEGQERRLDIVLGGAAIYGRVTLGGKPLPAVVVVDSRASSPGISGGSSGAAQTGEDGRYRIEGLRPGVYALSIRASQEETAAEISMVHEVRLGADDVEFNIELSGARIGGTVTDDAGNPIAGANITVVPDITQDDRVAAIVAFHERPFRIRLKTDDKGAFSLSGLDPGPYRLAVHRDGYARRLVTIQKPADSDLPGVTIKLEREAEVFAQPRYHGGTVPTRVFFTLCRPDGRVVAENEGGEVDADTGECRVHGLGPGQYLIYAQILGMDYGSYAPVLQQVTIASGRRNLFTVDFKPGQNLVVKIGDAGGAPVVGGQVVLDPGGDASLAALVSCDTLPYMILYRKTQPDGSLTIKHVADGDYIVRVRCDGYHDAAVPVTIAGQDAEVTVTLKPAK